MSTAAELADAYRGRRVFVTGHTGFKGSWLVSWLTRMGATVTGFSDGVPTSPSHFELLSPSVETIIGDVADEAAVVAAMARARPDIVFHLAAQALVRAAYTDPVGTYRTNVMGTLAVLQGARNSDTVRAVVSATTDKVYRNREWVWGYREDDVLGGSDPYSASKSCVELMTESYRTSFGGDRRMLIASVRAGNVIGGGDWAADRLLPDIVRAAYGNGHLSIRNARSTRPWQHVLDPLAGYLTVGSRLLAGDASVAEAWNFGPVGQARCDVGTIVGQARRRFETLQVTFAPDTTGAHESGLLELDSAKAVNRLGWRPVWEGELLERTLDWYHAYYRDGTLLTAAQLDAYCHALDNASV